MKKLMILAVCLPLTTMAAYDLTNLIPSDINLCQCSWGIMWTNEFNRSPLALLLSFAQGKEMLATPPGKAGMARAMLTAARGNDDDEKAGDDKGDDKEDSKKGDKKDKEKEDEGGGWDRLWDAPKLG